MKKARVEFESLQELDEHLAAGKAVSGSVFQSLDLRKHAAVLEKQPLHGAIFLGCELEASTAIHAARHGALIFPKIPHQPFDPYRGALYTVEELMAGFDPEARDGYARTLDGRIYRRYLDTGGVEPTDILETLSRRLHDHAITDALQEVLQRRHIVAIMGGHGLTRSHPLFRSVAQIARTLTQKDYLMVSGGGPGAMEATNLGAWLANRSLADLDDAIRLLSSASTYHDRQAWLKTAFEVRRAYPNSPDSPAHTISVGIPTWLYGHEPPNAFATHIAKYFANSVREDGLLTIAKSGIIFAPGSAGTIQEIFQDAAQNHYKTAGGASPMIFLDQTFWTKTTPVFPLLQKLAAGRDYAEFLAVTDDPNEAVERIEAFRIQQPEQTAK